MTLSLRPVIHVDPDKCVNCHKCIAVCPIKMCNDGSGDYVKINHDLCLGCGACIKACTHQARSGIDDMQEFLNALNRGEDIVAVAAPAVAAGFDWLRFNSFLISIGVKAVFDVSFGAELTVKSYIHNIMKHNPPLVIAQPCPALVTYIELRHPELLPYLAPADSPMMHTMKFIKDSCPQYRSAKLLIVSPCYEKNGSSMKSA